jgi:hypothetical protein
MRIKYWYAWASPLTLANTKGNSIGEAVSVIGVLAISRIIIIHLESD